jgi:hypothetical protein
MLVGMEPSAPCQTQATREFAGPWWLAIALLELQSHDVVEPVLREVAPLEIGPVVRAGTEGCLALSWSAESPVPGPETVGELRIVEVDGNRTELRLSGALAGALGRETTLDELVERLARRIETAVAREIGTQ